MIPFRTCSSTQKLPRYFTPLTNRKGINVFFLQKSTKNGSRTVIHLDCNSKVSYCPKIGVNFLFLMTFCSLYFRLFARTKSRELSFPAYRPKSRVPMRSELVSARTLTHRR
eukprot:sb/3477235/